MVFDTLSFLFAGKSYVIFSLLFGLSFFMQMDSQAQKENDFRLRFVWRLTILLVLDYLNGIIYMDKFFVVYAIIGIILIPLYKIPTKLASNNKYPADYSNSRYQKFHLTIKQKMNK